MDNAYRSADSLREVCHDLRQPTAAVLALAEAVLAEADVPESARHRLEQIIGLAEWQSDVIENWLAESRQADPPGAGHSDVLQAINGAAAAERLTWTGDLTQVWPPEPVSTPIHPVILRRMVANLLANATRAAGPHGSVTVEVSRNGRWALLAVEDDGPGVGRLGAGSGLGLSAVARQAARYQGRLECGRGTLGGGRACLRLPVAESGTEARAADATCPV